MTTLKYLVVTFTLILCAACWSIAQAQMPALDVAIDSDQVRFVAEAQELRVEVYAPSGEMIFDSGAVTGQPVAWRMQNAKGERVADGVYLVTISMKTAAGQVRKRIEQVVVGREQQEGKRPSSPNSPSATITGTGTTGKIAKFTNTTVIGNSVMTEASGKIGIGITTPSAFFHVKEAGSDTVILGNSTGSGIGVNGVSTDGVGVKGQSTTASGVRGNSGGTGGGVAGVHGVSTASNGTGVLGEANVGIGGVGVSGASKKGTGVLGNSTSGPAVEGDSQSGNGVIGSSQSGFGVFGISQTGTAIKGITFGSGTGVVASSGGGGIGVDASSVGSSGPGTAVKATSTKVGVDANATDVGGTGVRAKGGFWGVFATGGFRGVEAGATEDNGIGMEAECSGQNCRGLWGRTEGGGIGVNGFAGAGGDGVVGETDSGFGVMGTSNGVGGLAGRFSGNVQITGNLTKGGGSFKIDHPLDPANKYLYHSFVESPDMMNIYNGNVTLDQNGEAVVIMPRWFSALNKEFRYQLTAIGAPGPNLYIADEIKGNHFRIAGGAPGMKVSWQLTGIRHDAWADAHRIPVEEEKPERERGSYLHPELFKQPEEKGIDWALRPEMMRRMKAERETRQQQQPPPVKQ